MHHDVGHASVSRMVGIVALSKRISMHVMQVGLVLCQGGAERYVGIGPGIFPSASMVLRVGRT